MIRQQHKTRGREKLGLFLGGEVELRKHAEGSTAKEGLAAKMWVTDCTAGKTKVRMKAG